MVLYMGSMSFSALQLLFLAPVLGLPDKDSFAGT